MANTEINRLNLVILILLINEYGIINPAANIYVLFPWKLKIIWARSMIIILTTRILWAPMIMKYQSVMAKTWERSGSDLSPPAKQNNYDDHDDDSYDDEFLKCMSGASALFQPAILRPAEYVCLFEINMMIWWPWWWCLITADLPSKIPHRSPNSEIFIVRPESFTM